MKNKITTFIVIGSTIILAGIAIFTAVRLYQLRQVPVAPTAPESKPRAQQASSCSLSFTLTSPSPTPNTTCTASGASCVNIGGNWVINIDADTNSTAAFVHGYDDRGWQTIVKTYTAIKQSDGKWTATLPQSDLGGYQGSMKADIYINQDNENGYCKSLEATVNCGSSTPSATPTSTANPTGTPNSCNGTCGSNNNCQGNFVCYQGFCRNPSCVTKSNCSCDSTSTPKPTGTQASLPNSGTSFPSIFGMGLGVIVIIGSLFLAL